MESAPASRTPPEPAAAPTPAPRWSRPALLRIGRGAVFAGGGAALATSGPWLPQTLGVALVLAGACELLPPLARAYPFVDAGARVGLRGRAVAVDPLLRRLLPPAVLFVAACGLLFPCLLGRFPVWQDHPVHLTKVWYFLTHLLRRGRVDGWMDYWFYGQPAETLYPPLSDYWLALGKVLTLGLASWDQVYAWGFLLMYFLCALAVYLFAARSLGRLAGLLAALAFLFDRGEYREGGWQYTVYWGVWPQIFATALAFLALGKIEDVLERGRRRDYVVCALFAALALLGHPMNLIVFVLAAPAYLIARTATSRQPLGPMLARFVAAFALGFALAAYWVLPFSASAAYAAHYGDTWKAVAEMARALWGGGLFQLMPPPILLLAVGGAAVGFLERRFLPVFLALLALGLLFASSSTAFAELHLLDLSQSFGKIQYQRLAIPAKIAVYVLAAHGVVSLGAGVRRFRESAAGRAAVSASASATRRLPLFLSLGLVAAPFVLPLARAYATEYAPGLGQVATRRDDPAQADYRRFLEWSAAEHGPNEIADGPGYYRIAYVGPHDSHFFADAPVFNHTPAYKTGFMPASNFLYKPEDPDPELFRSMSVKWIVSRGAGVPGYLVERRFGSIVVQRFPEYDAARAHLEGAGRVEVHVDSPEHWTMRVSDAGAGSRLVVHTAYFPSWHLYEDGRELAVQRFPASHATPSDRDVHDYDFLISAPVRDGTVELVYRRRAVDWLGDAVSWLAILLCAALLLGDRPRVARWIAKAAPAWAFVERRAVLLLAGLAIACGGAAAARAAIARHRTYVLHEHFDPGPAHANVLVEVASGAGAGESARPCTDVRDGSIYCSPADWNRVGPFSDRFDGVFHPCLLAHPVGPGETLRVRFFHVPIGRALVLGDGLSDPSIDQAPGGAPVTLDLAIDGTPVGSDTRPNVKGWSERTFDTTAFAGARHELEADIRAASDAMRYFCFDVLISGGQGAGEAR